MSSHTPAHMVFENMLMDGLRRSKIFKIQRETFHDDTGLSLDLTPADPTVWSHHHLRTRSTHADHCPYYEELRASHAPVRLGATPIANIIPVREETEPSSTPRISAGELIVFKRKLRHFAEELGRRAGSLPSPRHSQEPRSITKVRKYIHAHLDEQLSLGQLAEIARLSESHFCRQFRETVGMTLTNYVNCCRIEWARRELLRPQARVAEVSFLVGYKSISQFNRNFQKLLGRTPSRYRKEQARQLPIDSLFS